MKQRLLIDVPSVQPVREISGCLSNSPLLINQLFETLFRPLYEKIKQKHKEELILPCFSVEWINNLYISIAV